MSTSRPMNLPSRYLESWVFLNLNVQQVLAQVNAQVNLQNVVIDVSNVLNDTQIQLLVQALNSNPQASLNATQLTSAMQRQGQLTSSEHVVGYHQGKIYKKHNRR